MSGVTKFRQIDEPNVTLPLAASYNTRGIDGFTNAVTNALDQRKVNSMYVPVMNVATGKNTLYLVKRPGTTLSAATYGSTGQVAHLLEVSPNNNDTWVFSTSGNDVRASDSSGTTTIVTSAGYKPAFVETTAISGANTIVVQLRNASFAQRVFFASVIGSWTEIVDPVFTGLTLNGKLEHMDGYAFVLDSMNRIYNSDINSLSSWGASSYITKTITQDIPRGLAKLGQQIIAFNQYTMEVFRNAGNSVGSPLVRVPELEQRYGMVQPNLVDMRNYYCRVGQRIYWASRFANGVMSYDGAKVEKVSNAAIDRILEDNDSGTHYGMFRMRIAGAEAIAISLNKTSDTAQRWLMFFPDLNEWFEWTSTVVCPTTAMRDPILMLGVGANQHKVYFPSRTDNWQDDGTNYDRIHQFQWPNDGNDQKFMRWCGLKGTIERSACTEGVQFSDDDGQTWSSSRTIDRTSIKQNLYRCGSFKKRLVRLTNSTNHECRLEKFLARVE